MMCAQFFIPLRKIFFILSFTLLTIIGCDDDVYPPIPQSGSPETFKLLKIQFTQGSITYNAVPVTPIEKKVHADLYFRMTNTDPNNAFKGLTIPYGNLYHNLTLGPIGTVFFKTDWDGSINPGQSVTVHLTSTDTSKSYIEPRCDQYVYFNLNLIADKDNSKLIVTDSMKFTCTF